MLEVLEESLSQKWGAGIAPKNVNENVNETSNQKEERDHAWTVVSEDHLVL